MRKRNCSYWFAGLLLLLLLAGCAMFQGPQSKPAPDAANTDVSGTEPSISVYMHENGESKTMKMEEYIAGVVAGEMKNNWPIEALAAQAILARTFTIAAVESKGGVPAHGTQASTDIKEFQAYDATAINDSVRQAVEMTRGLVAAYQGVPIQAWFHASAGGVTATAKEGLNYKEAEPAYTQSVPSPDENAPADIQNWQAVFTAEEIIAALHKLGKQATAVRSIRIAEKGPSGRAVKLLINDDVEVAAPEFRNSLDSTRLKSLLLTGVNVAGDQVTFSGRGYGHGVGMSQWGAHKMAAMGKNAREIIGQYFNGVTIEKRWN